MTVIAAIICLVIGGGLWWINSSTTIYDPVLHAIVAGSPYIFFGFGIVLFLMTLSQSRRSR